MARAASLSRFHFVRLFSLVHGETPHAFLRRKRTAVARRHLAVGSACSEAASRAGFGSRSSLFRNLRKTAPAERRTRIMLPLCLIVGSDAVDPAGLQREFDGFGFKPYAVETFSSALGMIRQWQFDAVIVDGDGRAGSLLHALPELRDRSNAPIVVVWSDGAERRQIEALQGGATEVIVKPASARLIAAKLHRLIEIGKDRPAANAEEPRTVVRLGPLRLDPRRAAASVGDAPLALTLGEFELLLLLASRPGEFVHRDTIGADARQQQRRPRRPAQRRHAHLPDPQEAARRGRDDAARRNGLRPGLLPALRRGARGDARRRPSSVVRLARAQRPSPTARRAAARLGRRCRGAALSWKTSAARLAGGAKLGPS